MQCITNVSNNNKLIWETISLDDIGAHKPLLLSHTPLNQTLFVGQNVNFSCNYESSLATGFGWFKINSTGGKSKIDVCT